MYDQNPFRAEIEQILRAHTHTRYAKVFLGMTQGLRRVGAHRSCCREPNRRIHVCCSSGHCRPQPGAGRIGRSAATTNPATPDPSDPVLRQGRS